MSEPASIHPDAQRLADFALGKLAEADAAQTADHLAGSESRHQAVVAAPSPILVVEQAGQFALRPPTSTASTNSKGGHGTSA